MGGASADFLDGEWGDERLTGGEGAHTFTFWSDNWDYIRDNLADLWGNDTITDSGLLIDLGGGDSVLLRDVTLSELSATQLAL